jgi:transcription initiation factor TFIID subunit 2
MSNSQDCHNHPELKRKLYSALAESDEGELSIAIPHEVSLRPSGNAVSGNVVSEGALLHFILPLLSHYQSQLRRQSLKRLAHSLNLLFPSLRLSLSTFPIAYAILSMDFSSSCPLTRILTSVQTIIFLIEFADFSQKRVPHAYTTPSSPDAARCWVPCVDNLWEKCTWEFEFVVPRYLEEQEPSRSSVDDESDDIQDANPTIVVCSGDLVEQVRLSYQFVEVWDIDVMAIKVAHPYNSSKTIFLFSQAVLTSVQHIAFAAGPFHLLSIPVDNSADDASGSQPPMYAFCLPGHESMLANSVPYLRTTMNFYSTEFGSYPFGSYKLVFVEELPVQRCDGATLSLVTIDLLHGEDAIEQALETRHALSHALACQWVGINIQPKAWSDIWLVNGLGLYITGLFLRKFLGNNEYRFRLKKDMQRVLEYDNGSMPPICQPQNVDPPDSATLSFVNLKAPLVLHILDRRLGKSGTSLGLSRVLPKVFLSAISGEMPNNAIATQVFLRTCRKVSGVDPRSFAEQWIYGSGCPAFGFSASFSRKKMAVEITMRQEAPAFKTHENNEILRTLMKPVPFFEVR